VRCRAAETKRRQVGKAGILPEDGHGQSG
jgi:hypothetical protein